mgnify:FL=1
MSTLYVTEPPTDGKVILHTSKGEIEVELWAKEAPKAVRNLLTLALEGYYDACVWHRIVPGFCIQTGDPTATGHDGESIYGSPFADEFHQRLRFNRRGLVAMANAGEANTNDSQFFVRTSPASVMLTADYARCHSRAAEQTHHLWSCGRHDHIQCACSVRSGALDHGARSARIPTQAAPDRGGAQPVP